MCSFSKEIVCGIVQINLILYYFSYGEVIDCVVMKNNETGRSRGFGFVTFADPDNVLRALDNCPHNLDGRTIGEYSAYFSS